jgi:hypothetical protein
VVLLIVWMLRSPLKGLINRILEAEVFGARITAARAETEAARGFNQRAESILHEPPGSGPQVPSEDREHASPDGKVEPGEGAAGYEREQVAEFVRAAAEAGFAVGASRMFLSTPEPVLGWSGKGDRVPTIKFWRGPRVNSTAHSSPLGARGQGTRVQRLEDEIRNLTLENHSAPSAVARITSGRDGAIKELKERLRELDPSSPWAQ